MFWNSIKLIITYSTWSQLFIKPFTITKLMTSFHILKHFDITYLFIYLFFRRQNIFQVNWLKSKVYFIKDSKTFLLNTTQQDTFWTRILCSTYFFTSFSINSTKITWKALQKESTSSGVRCSFRKLFIIPFYFFILCSHCF